MTAQMEFTTETTARCVGCDLTYEGSGGRARVKKRYRKPENIPVINYGEFTFGSMEELAFVPISQDDLEWGRYGNAFRCDNCKNVYPTEQWTWDDIQKSGFTVTVEAIAISD